MMNFLNRVRKSSAQNLPGSFQFWKSFTVFCAALLPNSLFASDMGGIIIVIIWLMLDLPMFILYLIQLSFSLYFLRKDSINTFVSVINKVLFGAGILFGVLSLMVHLIFLLDMIKNASTRNAMAFSLLIYVIILALSIFSGRKSWELMKKKPVTA